MKREDIEKAARMFVCDTKTDAEGKILRQKGFKKGAEWRINSVWHDAEEHPKDWNETCLVELKSGGRSFCLLSNFDHAGGFSCLDEIHNKNIHVIKGHTCFAANMIRRK